MIHDPINALRSRAEMLQVAELLHRIGNDYTRAIAFASLRAVNASSNEARSALNEVVNHLQASVEMYRVLRPPSVAGSADLTHTIARLCRTQSDVSEFRRRGIDLLLAYDNPIEIDGWRCWHASLIIAELINNACHHALGSTSGLISVGIAESDGRVLCSVSNDGAVDKNCMPSLGTQLIDALAVGLDGFVERQFGESAATTVLSFPLVGQSERVPRSESSSLDMTGPMVLASQHAPVIRFSRHALGRGSSLMTRFAVTAFLIANTVMKCFAIARAMSGRAALVGGRQHERALADPGNPVGRSR
jgi:two-component sensor histidine kinase